MTVELLVVTEYFEDYEERYASIAGFLYERYQQARIKAVLYSRYVTESCIASCAPFDAVWHVSSIAKARRIVKQTTHDVMVCLVSHTVSHDNLGLLAIAVASPTSKKIYCLRNLVSLKAAGYSSLSARRKVIFSVARGVVNLTEARLKIVLLHLLFAVAYRFLRVVKSLGSSPVRNHIVIRLDYLGDMIVSIPYLCRLRAAVHPERLSLLTTTKGAAIVKEQMELGTAIRDNLMVWDPPWHLRRGMLRVCDVFGIFKMILRLTSNAYETVIQPVTIGIGVMIAVLLMGKRTVAVIDPTLPLSSIMSKHVAFPISLMPKKNYHMSDYWQMTLKAAGVDTAGIQPRISFSEADLAAVRKEVGTDRDKRVILLNIGAGTRVREWESGRFAALAGKLASSGHRVLLIGGRDDRKKAAEIMESYGEHGIVDLVGDLTLNMAAAALLCADVVVTADTGIMHLAAAVGAKIVALFGAGNVLYCRPLTQDHIIVRHELGCSGCVDICFTNAPPPCMDAITVDEVYDAVIKLLNSTMMV